MHIWTPIERFLQAALCHYGSHWTSHPQVAEIVRMTRVKVIYKRTLSNFLIPVSKVYERERDKTREYFGQMVKSPAWKLGLCLSPMSLDQGGIFIVPHLLCHGVLGFCGLIRRPVHTLSRNPFKLEFIIYLKSEEEAKAMHVMFLSQ